MVIDLVGLRLGTSDDLTLDSSDGDSDAVLSGDGAGDCGLNGVLVGPDTTVMYLSSFVNISDMLNFPSQCFVSKGYFVVVPQLNISNLNMM